MQYAFYLDTSRCTGCKTCQMACKDYKDLPDDVTLRRVYDYEGGETTYDEDGCVVQNMVMYHVSVSCNHCANPACVEACPTGAMQKDSETGIVSVAEDECIACGACVAACPYDAPIVREDVGHSQKCNACQERLMKGLQPICVEACPLRALGFGPLEDMMKLGDIANIAPLPSSDITTPSLFIKACHDAQPTSGGVGGVANTLELVLNNIQ
jgi:anaerobic dimethyl sulfoxide reductase subunit B (iron-sulfur subunit)